MTSLVRLLIPFTMFLSGMFLPAFVMADHHACDVGGIDRCVSALIPPVTSPDQPPENVLTLAFGSLPAGASTTKTLTVGVTHNPGFTVSLTSFGLAGADAADFGLIGGTCALNTPMTKGTTCTIDINFNPATVGAKNAAILISTADMTRTTNLTGTSTLPPPVINSALAASGTTGVLFPGYQITATNSPTSFSASPLPPGLTVNATGAISGTPTLDGTFNTIITATNASGTDTETVVFTIAANVPVVTSAATASGASGLSFSYQITATNNPATYGATNLPPGVTVNTATGLISGTPTTAGTYTASVTATNASGTASKTVTISISPVPPTSGDATMTVPLNTPTSLDLAPFITGPFVNGVRIASKPSFGDANATGTVVTYTPRTDFFGHDEFSYIAFNNDGDSMVATVTVTINERPDPSQNPDVGGLIESQMSTSRRFAKSQIFNFTQRMEALHKHRGSAPVSGGLSIVEKNKGGIKLLNGRVLSEPRSNKHGHQRSVGELHKSDYDPEPDDSHPLYASLLNTLQDAATTGSINLAYSSNDGNNTPSWLPKGTNFWLGGTVSFGSRDETSRASEIAYSTDGISMGVDHEFSDELSLGIGLGYGRGWSDIGENGSENKSTGTSITVYGSYMPTTDFFIDGMLGYGRLNHDSSRYVSPVKAFAELDRDGDQLFGSISAGYEFRKPGLTFSPYGRFDFSINKLDSASETGVGMNALTYHDEKHTSSQLSLGLRAESVHRARFGWALPHSRIEFNHNFDGDRDAVLSYADLGGAGTRYNFKSDKVDENFLSIGIGSDFIFRNGIKLGIDYQATHSLGPEHDQIFSMWITKNTDEDPTLGNIPNDKYIDMPIHVQTGLTFDDNLNRVVDSDDKLSDRIFNVNVGTGTSIQVSRKTRLLLNASIGLERLYYHHELERNTADLKAEYQYRTSAQFDALTYGIAGKWAFDNYASSLRDGENRSLGISARQNITDRINWFTRLSKKIRDADNKVFDNNEESLLINIDYSLGRKGSLYLGQEYRRGYSVSSTPDDDYYSGAGVLSVEDDAYSTNERGTYTSTRYKSRTSLTTIGYNLPLGSDDTLDFSIRRIKATPDDNSVGNSSYTSNQFSIFYLTRF